MTVLSVLDQSPIRAGSTAADAIRETLELAQLCERLGYRRYWLAEHHNAGGLAGSSPEILIARVASVTSAMRVGSGGVMLSHYSPLKVAENFRMLETLYPGRIDLGVGRAPGSDGRTAMALAAGPGQLGVEHYPNQIQDLLGWLGDALPEGHRFHGVHAEPRGPGTPEVWLLGSSDQSAAYAAYFGLPFSYAHFIAEGGGAEVMQAYKAHFRPSAAHPAPQASIGVFAICAETDDEAKRLSASRDLWLARLRTGEPGPVPTVEEALAHPYDERERAVLFGSRRRTIAGSPETVKARLLALGREYGVDEFVVVTITHDPAARRRSYELLAQAFGLVE